MTGNHVGGFSANTISKVRLVRFHSLPSRSKDSLNNNCPLTAVLSVSNDSYSKFYLAYIGNILCCDVIYDLIKAEVHVQNCKTSDWSDCIYLVGHMINVCFD